MNTLPLCQADYDLTLRYLLHTLIAHLLEPALKYITGMILIIIGIINICIHLVEVT